MVGFITILVFSSARMQRFLSLGDTRYVKARVAYSVNEGFLN